MNRSLRWPLPLAACFALGLLTACSGNDTRAAPPAEGGAPAAPRDGGARDGEAPVPTEDPKAPEAPKEPPTTSGAARILDVHPDKARYLPGEPVTLTVVVEAHGDEPFTGPVRVQVQRLGEVVHEEEIVVTASPDTPVRLPLVWTPPPGDFTGYLVLAQAGDGEPASTAVDVSSTPFRFPRYGYLSEFPPGMTAEESAARVRVLGQEFHLNLLQFYDWMWRHEKLVERGEGGEIPDVWEDLFGRPIGWPVVRDLVDAAQDLNMSAMAYVMIYAAREGYGEAWPVEPAWGVFEAPNATRQLNVSFFNDTAIYLFDPSNPGWQDWIIDQYIEALELGGFDGVHIDQLGARTNVYTFDGQPLDLPDAFPVFLEEVDRRLTQYDPARSACTFNIVDGAVDGWAVEEVATSPACDFLYSELWYEASTYEDLRAYVESLREIGGNRAVVLAAYAQYNDKSGPVLEAEDAELAGVEVDTDHPGYTGDGFVDAFESPGDSITWELEMPEDAHVTFVVRASNGASEAASRTLYVDDTPVGKLWFGPTGSWSTWSSDPWLQRRLSAGSHEVRLSYDEDDTGAINVDHLQLGEFDEDAVRLQNAAISASGATHIQLGDDVQVLAHEYYPNRSKSVTPSLRRALGRYYTFITAYENLLFDTYVEPIENATERLALEGAPLIESGANGVWPILRRAPGYEMVHLVNLVGVDDDQWRDTAPTPTFHEDGLSLRYYADQPDELESAWLASPDFGAAAPVPLELARGTDERGAYVAVTVPRLEYWDMIVFARAAP